MGSRAVEVRANCAIAILNMYHFAQVVQSHGTPARAHGIE
jgi:hypothetical protein